MNIAKPVSPSAPRTPPPTTSDAPWTPRRKRNSLCRLLIEPPRDLLTPILKPNLLPILPQLQRVPRPRRHQRSQPRRLPQVFEGFGEFRSEERFCEGEGNNGREEGRGGRRGEVDQVVIPRKSCWVSTFRSCRGWPVEERGSLRRSGQVLRNGALQRLA